MVARPAPDGSATTEWTAINSCLVPAAALDGQEVVTSEGLGTPGALHPVQRAMMIRDGMLRAYPVQAPHALVTGLHVTPAYDVPGVARVLTADAVTTTADNGLDPQSQGNASSLTSSGSRPVK